MDVVDREVELVAREPLGKAVRGVVHVAYEAERLCGEGVVVVRIEPRWSCDADGVACELPR